MKSWRSRKSLHSLTLALFLSSCLTSREPFVTSDAVFPLESGTKLQTYTVENDKLTPGQQNQITIQNHVYRYEEGNSIYRFRVARIGDSRFFLAMFLSTTPTFYYGLIEELPDPHDSFVLYMFVKDAFIEYANGRDSPREGVEWTHQGSAAEFESRYALEETLIGMVEAGHYTSARVFDPIETGFDPNDPADVMAGILALGVLLFGGAAMLGGNDDAASSGDSEWQAKYWCKTEFLDPDPVNKPTRCYTKDGSSWEMHWLHPCYGEEGWCDG